MLRYIKNLLHKNLERQGMRITVMGVKLYQHGLEGYFWDPGFDQNTEQDSQKHKISRRDTSFDCCS